MHHLTALVSLQTFIFIRQETVRFIWLLTCGLLPRGGLQHTVELGRLLNTCSTIFGLTEQQDVPHGAIPDPHIILTPLLRIVQKTANRFATYASEQHSIHY